MTDAETAREDMASLVVLMHEGVPPEMVRDALESIHDDVTRGVSKWRRRHEMMDRARYAMWSVAGAVAGIAAAKLTMPVGSHLPGWTQWFFVAAIVAVVAWIAASEWLLREHRKWIDTELDVGGGKLVERIRGKLAERGWTAGGSEAGRAMPANATIH